MISYRTSGGSEGPTTASSFVSIPQPVGVQDGDLLIVGIWVINNPLRRVQSAPLGWTELTSTRVPVLGERSLTIFWKVAINEPVRWVFELTGDASAGGCVIAYANADGFEPIETVIPYPYDVLSTDNPVGGVSTSIGGEQIALFLSNDNALGDYTSVPGYEKRATRLGSNYHIQVWDRQVNAPTSFPAFNAIYSVPTSVAITAAVVVRPSFGLVSSTDARRRLVRGFPDGVEDIYDLEPGGDYYKLFQSIALTIKTFGFDLIDLLRLEIIPSLSRYKLPEWERIFGISTSKTTLLGTILERQAQVLAYWRAAAGQGSSIPTVQSIIAAVLGYLSPNSVQVLEVNLVEFTALHTYIYSVAETIPAFGFVSSDVFTSDPGLVKTMRLFVTITHPSVEDLTIILTAPGGETTTFSNFGSGAAVAEQFVLFAPSIIDLVFAGPKWTLTVTNAGAVAGTVDTWSLFVEGAPGPLGGDAFDWGIYADPLLLGQNGNTADLDAARDLIERVQFNHTDGHLFLTLTPLPGAVDSIPGECIPT